MATIQEFMDNQITKLYQTLSAYQYPVFEDDIAEDEENDLLSLGLFECFVFDTAGMTVNDDNATLSQVVNVYYYSENRNDLDKQMYDIITAIDNLPRFSFVRSRKQRLQKKDTDRYIDLISLEFNRNFKKQVNCYG